jgi:hypothetical protein
MKKRIVKLNESDLELLVKKIIREEEMDPNSSEEGGEEEKDNPKDVEMFLDAMKKYFMDRYPRFANKINTRKEKAMLLAALAEELGVDTNLINMAKAELKKSGLGK